MYPVSDKFLEEISKTQRNAEITGYIQTQDGTNYEISNDNVVNNSLTVTDQFTGGSFCVGSVYARNMTVKLLGFQNVDTRNLSNARIVPIYRLRYSDTEFEDVPLGIFFIDGSQTKRKFDTVTISATDKMQNFDREAQSLENVTLYEAISQACAACDVSLGISDETFAEFPNADTVVSFTTEQIQTWRDMLMWIADLTGTFCRVSRASGSLEFVQMKADIGSDGRIIPVMEIPGDVRFTTDFSDTTVRVPKIVMSRNGTVVSGAVSWTANQRAVMFAAMELDENPIIANKTNEEVSDFLKKIARHISTLLHRPFETSFNGNPALDVGDYVRLRGGAIDISQSYATGIITYSQWKFRGKHSIKCKSYTTTVRPSDFSIMSLAADSSEPTEEDNEEETTPDIMRKPKSQIEKRVDKIEAGVANAGGVGMKSPLDSTSEIFNCYDGEGKNEAGVSGQKNYTTVRGYDNTAKGYCSVVGGNRNAESGLCNHVFGASNKVNGSGNLVHGTGNIVDGSSSFVVGSDNFADYAYNAIVGEQCTAKGYYNVLTGRNCSCENNNSSCFLAGIGLKTSASTALTVLGQYNISILEPDMLLIVGNGLSDDERSNALTLDKYGNLTIKGTLTCAGVNQTAESVAVAILSDDTDAELQTYTAESENIVKFGGVTYTFTVAETGEITGVTTSTGKSMTADIPAGLSNKETHNAAFMALAITTLK